MTILSWDPAQGRDWTAVTGRAVGAIAGWLRSPPAPPKPTPLQEACLRLHAVDQTGITPTLAAASPALDSTLKMHRHFGEAAIASRAYAAAIEGINMSLAGLAAVMAPRPRLPRKLKKRLQTHRPQTAQRPGAHLAGAPGRRTRRGSCGGKPGG